MPFSRARAAPEATVVPELLAPKAELCVIKRKPALRVVGPVKVFAAVRVSEFAPVFWIGPAPVITPLALIEALASKMSVLPLLSMAPWQLSPPLPLQLKV